jgi:peptidoglycan/LPS O-acetylase OafA/YrhL
MMGISDLTSPPTTQGRVRDGEIPALTGLRFLAAISVAISHGSSMILKFEPRDVVTGWLPMASAFGMTLFFVLSGFVIHYNYRRLVTARGWSGLGAFLWARFARLYPLFLLILVLDVLLGRQLFDFLLGNTTGFTNILQSLPYYLLFIQSWVYVPFGDNSLIYVTGDNVALTWSISTEWFFYLAYPVIALLVLRVRRPIVILFAMLIWSLLWGGMASFLDGRSTEIDAWAVGHYGPIAGMADGYQDSFVRWLLYFSPYLRIGEFILGCLTAQLFLLLRDRIVTPREQAIGRLLLTLSIISVPLIIFLTYSSEYQVALLFSLRLNYGLAPSVALILFGAARYENGVSRFLRSRPVVALGEASYSIYLTHFLIFLILTSYLGAALPATVPNIVFLYVRFVFVLSLICVISLGLQAIVEVPTRRWLRRLWSAGGVRRPAIAASIAAMPALAALSCLAAQGYMFVDKSHVVAGISLISATYGGNCDARRGNATQSLLAACNGHESCDYTVDVAKLGDPAGGCAKDFTADYACMPGSRPHKASLPGEAGLGSHVLLTCSAAASQANAATTREAATGTGPAAPIVPAPPKREATGIDILSATYGENCGAHPGNSTADMQAACSGKASCTYIVDVQRLGDPVNGCQKNFTATYKCLGKPGTLTREAPAEAGLGTSLDLSCS